MDAIKTEPSGKAFVDQVEEMSHSNISRCWHCLICSGGCPFSEDMDYLPNQIIRMTQLGFKEEALASSTIWLCVGCHTCSMECPNSIDVAAIMDALRQIAIAENREIGEPGILSFHQAVLDSIFQYGRAHKLGIMMKYKWAEKNLFSDIDLGLKMFFRRKLDIAPSKVTDKKKIRSLFQTKGGRHEKNSR